LISLDFSLEKKSLECYSGSCPEYLLRSKSLVIVSLIFIFALKIHFYVKMKIRETISLQWFWSWQMLSGHDPEHSRSFRQHKLTYIKTVNKSYPVYYKNIQWKIEFHLKNSKWHCSDFSDVAQSQINQITK